MSRLTIVSLRPRRARMRPTRPIQTPPTRQAATAMARSTPIGGSAETNGATAAAASPPSTTAPSPPITTSPSCAGRATHRAVSNKGEARCRVFCSENELPNAPRHTNEKKSPGDLPRQTRNSENAAAATKSATNGMIALSSRLRSQYKRSSPLSAARAEPVSSRGRETLVTLSRERADHSLDEIVHLLQFDRRLGVGLPRARDLIASIVLQRALDDGEAALHHLRLHGINLLACRIRYRRTERRHFNEILGETPTHEIRQRLTLERFFGEHLVDRRPIPFGAGEITFRRELRLVGVIAADIDAAPLGRLDNHLWPVDMAGDDVDAAVDKAIRRLRLLHRHRPIAGEDHLRDDGWVDGFCAERERVDVHENLRDRLRRNESELLGFGDMRGGDAVQVLAHADIAEIRAGIFRMLAVVPQAAAMAELDILVFLRNLQHVRIEIAEARRE